MKTAILSTLILLPGLLQAQQGSSTADVDGWSKIKWGMTVSKAREALGDQASDMGAHYKPGKDPLISRFVVQDAHIGDIPAGAIVKTKWGSELVSAVTIIALPKNSDRLSHDDKGRAGTFTVLKDLLIEKYGAPETDDHAKDTRPQYLHTVSRVFWSLPSTSITLTWEETSSSFGEFGSLVIEYRAVDKKSLDAL